MLSQAVRAKEAAAARAEKKAALRAEVLAAEKELQGLRVAAAAARERRLQARPTQY